MSVKKAAASVADVRRRPTERLTGAVGIATFLVSLGLDRPTAGWIALGIAIVPNVISPLVDWWRSRP